MNRRQVILISFYTIARKEVVRFFRIWTQTLLPSVVTSVLYFLIFGAFIGSQVGAVQGVSYMQFIVPGLVMMAVITNAFSNVVSSFFGSKFMHNLEEILVSPTPPWVIILGFVSGGVLRGLVVGFFVLLVSLFFTQLTVAHFGLVFLFIFLTSLLFSLAGLLNGIFSKKFDDVTIVPTFILTPLIYLGGVFYSIEALPPFWRDISRLNPILYMVDGFRYGFLGISDVNVWVSFIMLLGFVIIFAVACGYLIRRGVGLKN